MEFKAKASENLVLRHEREGAERGWGEDAGEDFTRNGDGEVGGNLLKRKSGLIMRVGGEWVRVERLTEMFKLA
jgi:hypothetical protein